MATCRGRSSTSTCRRDRCGDAPVLVFFYGGGWERGDKADLRETAQSLAASGMIVATPDYRLYPQAVFPQFVEDCAQAVARVREMVGRDGRPPRALHRRPFGRRLQCGDACRRQRYLAAAGVPAGRGCRLCAALRALRDELAYLPAPYASIFPAGARDRANVADFIDGKEPPMLLMTVEADDVVGAHDTERLAAAAMAHGGRAVVATYEGSDHIATFHGLGDPASAVRADLAVFIVATSARCKQAGAETAPACRQPRGQA